ncbi:MAG: DNA-directed RNA polymerase subunit alpha C-terminal domain-containing protein [Oscillospiraceae bacterium]
MMTENIIHEILGEDAPVMTSENTNEIIATLQYVLYLCCTERERSFLLMRYGKNMTYYQIADEAFLSAERVRQIITKSLKKISGYREMLKFGLNEWHMNEIRKLEEQYHSENISETYAQFIWLEDLNLSPRAYNWLRRAEIHSLAELTQRTTEEISRIRNLGEKTVAEIIDKVHSYGLKLLDEP